MSLRAMLAAALAASLPAGAALALDPPHDASQNSSCQDCHVGHNAPGAGLTTYAGNANLCDSCHKLHAGSYGFPWVTGDQAVPGASGRSHRWDADATARGASVPLDPEMAARLDAGRIECSTCHDQHNSGGRPGDATFTGGTQHVSPAVGVDQAPSGGGTGTMRVAAVAASAAPRGYRVRIAARGGNNLTLELSHDAGRTWLTGYAAVAGGAAVQLDDGANVTVQFPSAGNTYAVGGTYQFYVAYPFLRVSNVNDAMCEDCHRDRVHGSARVEGQDPGYVPDGIRTFSHPVGETLAKAYDRTGAILDANGAVQGGASADANPTNDLRLDPGGRVRCTSCHRPHNADSNSLTVDP
ncbi:MAG TPA: hypothetical protein VLS93_12185 [Anaeromyxobacteraceae bacterium]|nr:hypothetical protein [Anaeromyxobacteraceae bacterium]